MINLINGDCTVELKKLETNSITYAFTSPPYARLRNDKYKFFDDTSPDWYQMNIDVITELLRVTTNHVFYNIQANMYNRKDVYNIIGHFSDSIVDIHIWEKSNPMPAAGDAITNAVEYFFILGNTPLKSNSTYIKNIITTSVHSSMPEEHKAVMKPEVAYHFIENFTNEGDSVIDPFLGMGTTGITCKKLNRDFIGIELSETYYKLASDIINSTTVVESNDILIY